MFYAIKYQTSWWIIDNEIDWYCAQRIQLWTCMSFLINGMFIKSEPGSIWYVCSWGFFFGYCCLAHLSWKLKWAFLITCCPSSVSLLTSQIFIFFSRTTGPISTKLETKQPWVKGIQVWSNDRPRPFFKGKVAKTHWKKSSFPEPLDDLWTKLFKWMTTPFSSGDNNEMA